MNLKDVVCKLVLKFEPLTTFHCTLTQKHSKDGRGEAEVLEIFFFLMEGFAELKLVFLQSFHSYFFKSNILHKAEPQKN